MEEKKVLEREHHSFYVIFKIKMLKKRIFSQVLEFYIFVKKSTNSPWEDLKKNLFVLIINPTLEYSRFSRDANVKNIQKGDGYFLEEDSGGFTN